MKLVLALCLAPAAALVAPVAPAAAQTKMSETKADLEALQNSMPGPPGYWDPLDLAGEREIVQNGEAKTIKVAGCTHAASAAPHSDA